MIWDYLTSPTKRVLYTSVITRIDEENPSGRRGPGTTNHCAHGKDVVVEEILDWRPFDYFTVRFAPAGFPIDETLELTPTDGGTRLTLRQKIPRSKKAREAWSMMREQYAAMIHEVFNGLAAFLVEAASAADEPAEAQRPAAH